MYHSIIIGQGIAGSMLAWHLINAREKVLVIDQASNNNASAAASGIINPITGKHFVKSWLVDELIPYAIDTYSAIQQATGKSFFKQIGISHVFNSVEEINDWSVKAATDGYNRYLPSTQIENLDINKVNNPFGTFKVHGGCKVETVELLQAMRQWLIQHNAFTEDDFTEQNLQVEHDRVRYNNHIAQNIIFANGYKGASMELMQGIKYAPVKGEGLIIEVDDFYSDRIVHGDVMVSPTQIPNHYYVGSTYEWKFEDNLPTQAKRGELESRIRKTIASDFKVQDHVAGIRPASNNRRPIIGMLPNQKRVGVFNGMGTKGYSLAPYFARHFCNNLLNNAPLMGDIDVKRFYK